MTTLTPSYDTAVFNAQIPKEGPKAVPLTADFSAHSSYDINFLLTMAQQFMSIIQGVYVDNSANGHEVSITVGTINQLVKCPANSQGYFPLFVPKNAVITVSDPSGASTSKVAFIFYNIPMPAAVWGGLT